MRSVIAACALLLLARTARAEDGPTGARILLSVPLLLGATTEDGGGFVYGTRPEVILARVADRGDSIGPGWGAGAYGELLGSSGDLVAGGGATIVRYTGILGFAPSGGLYVRRSAPEPERGVVASLLVGFRGFEDIGPFDMAGGLRIDARFPTDETGERIVMVTLQSDLVAVGFLILAVKSLVTQS